MSSAQGPSHGKQSPLIITTTIIKISNQILKSLLSKKIQKKDDKRNLD